MSDFKSPPSPLSPWRKSQLRQRYPNLRVAAWQGDSRVALIGPARTGRQPDPVAIASCVAELANAGVAECVTPALSPYDCVPFERAQFTLYERLHLLARDLSEAPAQPDRKTQPGRRWHLDAVLDIDRRAFESFWQFDDVALNEARRATPANRYRILRIDGAIVGYHVTGRAGQKGYLQRLAVHPDVTGQGLGSALVFDCLSWLYQHKATEALVNTQERNQRALELYERHGFVRRAEGLAVMSWRRDQ